MGKGGIYGGYVLCKFDDGTSKEYPLNPATGTGSEAVNKAKSKRSPMVYIKAPVAEFFGWAPLTKKEATIAQTKTVKTMINGKPQTISKLVKMGTTGASRSVTVKFSKLQKINGKEVASLKVAMPSSYTFTDMMAKILESNKGVADIAAIVSPAGCSRTFGTPYIKKNEKRKR
jgi:hypothetical protein